MAAAMVVCAICKREHAKALSTKVRTPGGHGHMCTKCFENLSPPLKKELRIT